MRVLILEIRKGGLGDHLFYSHIPRIAKQTKSFDKVLISNLSIFRHPDNKRLIWEMNPYIDGFTMEKGIYHAGENYQQLADGNLLDRNMLLYGLDDGKRFHEPELYFRPEIRPELKNTVLFDPNYISYTGDIAYGSTIQHWFEQNQIQIDAQMQVRGKRNLAISCSKLIQSKNLEDFCSILISSKHIYCFTTGTATLAAALNKPVTVLYGTGHLAIYRHSKLHDYILLDSDYTFIDKLKKAIIALLGGIFRFGPK